MTKTTNEEVEKEEKEEKKRNVSMQSFFPPFGLISHVKEEKVCVGQTGSEAQSNLHLIVNDNDDNYHLNKENAICVTK